MGEMKVENACHSRGKNNGLGIHWKKLSFLLCDKCMGNKFLIAQMKIKRGGILTEKRIQL